MMQVRVLKYEKQMYFREDRTSKMKGSEYWKRGRERVILVGGGVGGWRFLDNKMRSDGGVVGVSVFLHFFFITFVLRQLF